MATDARTRLVDAGWTLVCERHIEIDTRGDARLESRYSTWRATKGTHEIVVKSKWGYDQPALVDLYKAAKGIDPDLQRAATEAGSGAWIIDPKELAALTGDNEAVDR